MGDYVIIGSGNGLVLSGNKPLPELMMTKIMIPYGTRHNAEECSLDVAWKYLVSEVWVPFEYKNTLQV